MDTGGLESGQLGTFGGHRGDCPSENEERRIRNIYPEEGVFERMKFLEGDLDDLDKKSKETDQGNLHT